MKINSRPILLAAAAILIVLPGCGGDGDPIDRPSETTTTSASRTSDGNGTNGNGTNDNGNGNNGQNKKPPDDELAWVPFGPGSPGGDQYEDYYTALQTRNCSSVGDKSKAEEGSYELLYYGLGQACVVLFESGDAGLWKSAQQDLSRAIDELAGAEPDCTEKAALALAKQIRAFPDRPPKVQLPSAGTTACDWGIETVVLAADEDLAASGPLGGGTSVVIFGERLTGATAVFFGDREVTLPNPEESGPRSITVESPPADAPGFVRIKVVSPGGERLSPEGVGFTYVDENGNGTENGTDPSPSPTETIAEVTG